MRLRRETGDFQIKINSTNPVEGKATVTFNKIKPGLGIEDLVGELVLFHDTVESVNADTEEVEVEEVDGILPVLTVSASSADPSSLLLELPTSITLPKILIAYNQQTGELSEYEIQASGTFPGFNPVGPAPTPIDQGIS